MGQASIPYISTVERHPQPTIYTTQCLCVCVCLCVGMHIPRRIFLCVVESLQMCHPSVLFITHSCPFLSCPMALPTMSTCSQRSTGRLWAMGFDAPIMMTIMMMCGEGGGAGDACSGSMINADDVT